jgi:hypothetical protein
MAVHRLSQFKLGSNAIGASNKDRVFISGGFQIKKSAETAKCCVGPGAASSPDITLNFTNKRISGVNIYTSITISERSVWFIV